MASYSSITIVVLVAFFGTSMAGIVPAAIAAPAPLIAAAPAPLAAAPIFGYAKAVPQNIPPHASRIDVSTRNLAAPYVAAPYVAAPYVASPVAASYIAAPAAASYIGAPAIAPAFAPAHLAYNPYAYPANFAAPLVQQPIIG